MNTWSETVTQLNVNDYTKIKALLFSYKKSNKHFNNCLCDRQWSLPSPVLILFVCQ